MYYSFLEKKSVPELNDKPAYIVHPLSEDSSVIEEKYEVVVISGFHCGC
jgi:hypothetical protein